MKPQSVFRYSQLFTTGMTCGTRFKQGVCRQRRPFSSSPVRGHMYVTPMYKLLMSHMFIAVPQHSRFLVQWCRCRHSRRWTCIAPPDCNRPNFISGVLTQGLRQVSRHCGSLCGSLIEDSCRTYAVFMVWNGPHLVRPVTWMVFLCRREYGVLLSGRDLTAALLLE
ncbi:hypothetical protein SCLCIDRAFT_689506 [Scleroderma citrinum Foug A]|uniref:Uncharacterized protein n=1 Tax=Scleroderma citrinum Foug A TaxID=1036808 RepID=A0A0C2ZQD0_9AGAM|nr:hypothetical protein SCLCIDRAFT_689506 [Scleroderma citrinum Foug A]